MTLFADTSALYALADGADRNHAAALETLHIFRRDERDLAVTSYVVVETIALVQRRLGFEAARRLVEDLLPLARIGWVDEALHGEGVVGWLAAGRRDLSLVDCVSFVYMRRLGFREVFAFDPHFAEQGFRVLPA